MPTDDEENLTFEYGLNLHARVMSQVVGEEDLTLDGENLILIASLQKIRRDKTMPNDHKDNGLTVEECVRKYREEHDLRGGTSNIPLWEVLERVGHKLMALPISRHDNVVYELQMVFRRLKIQWTPLKHK